MKIVLAVIFITVALCGSLGIAAILEVPPELLDWFLPLSTVASFVVGFFLAHRVSKHWWPAPQPLSIAELESLGRVRRVTHCVVRAFGIEELEDEGVHYVLELSSGKVLYLQGQYLYDYEPDEYGATPGAPRRFPCSEFDLLEDSEKGWSLDIDCRGNVLEPECIAPAPRKWPTDYVDRQIIDKMSYDELKRRFWSPDAA